MLAAAAALLAVASVPESKHAEARQSRRMYGRSRPNRRSPKEYAALAFHFEQMRRAPGSQAMLRMLREEAASSLGMSLKTYRDIARSNGAWAA